MPPEVSTQRELQEQSIKARKHELYVEDHDDLEGPRKSFREYLKETPAAPLSRNVKLMLWGAAAPVVLLFFAAMLTTSKGARVKVTDEPILDLSGKKAQAPPTIAKRNDPLAPPAVNKTEGEKPRGDSVKSNNSANKKENPKKKTSKNKNRKPKNNAKKSAEVAKKTDEANTDKDKDKDKAKDGEGEGEKKASKSGPANQKQAKDAKAKAGGNAPSSTPEKSKGSTSIFKKKRAPVFTYPKKNSEKKDESKNETDNPLPGLLPEPDPGASRP